jgi:hypothetical protein
LLDRDPRHRLCRLRPLVPFFCARHCPLTPGRSKKM